jgi:hypothetical protein
VWYFIYKRFLIILKRNIPQTVEFPILGYNTSFRDSFQRQLFIERLQVSFFVWKRNLCLIWWSSINNVFPLLLSRIELT